MKLVHAVLTALLFLSPAIAQDTTDDSSIERGSSSEAYEAFITGRYEEALAIWLPLANGGDVTAQFNIGVMYANGLGVERNMKSAMDWWRRASDQLHVRASHNLALAMLMGEPQDGPHEDIDFTAVLRLLKMASDAGYPNSEYTLGKLYQEGVGVEKDERRAAELFLSASIKGFAKAQYNLGKVFRDGAGMTKNDELSLFWFLEAAERGHARAEDKIATRYLSGQGVEKDEIEALKWSILAGTQGIQEAQRRRFDLEARLTQHDIEEAVQRAAAFAPRKGPVLNLPKAPVQ